MVRPHRSLLALARCRRVPAPADIDEFLRSASEHRMSGLVWTAVRSGELDLPNRAIQALAAGDMAVAAHHRRLWATLEEVTERLAAEGIGTVTFKGVTDEARWFGREGERPCADVDLVIDDIDRFDDSIALLAPGHPLIGQATRIARRGQARAVDLEVGGVIVDLHVDPVKVGPGWRHPEDWFARTLPFLTPSGSTVRVFDDEATYVLRLLHLGRDKFRYLLWLVEVDRIMQSGVDWRHASDLANLEGLAAPVGVAAEVVGEEFQREVCWPRAQDWRSRLWRHLWEPHVRLLGELGRKRFVRRSSWLLPLTMPGRGLESLAWLARTAFPPEALFDLKHPGGSGPYAWKLASRRSSYLLARRLSARMDRQQER